MTNKYLSTLIFIFLVFSLLDIRSSKAQCFINLSNINQIAPPSGSTICIGDAITLPNLTFVANQPGFTNPGIVWAVYDNLPTQNTPAGDPANLYNIILVNDQGQPIVGGGTADLSVNGAFILQNENPATIYIVPVIVPDISNPDAYSPLCTGVLSGFPYPSIILTNAESNPNCAGFVCQAQATTPIVSSTSPCANTNFTITTAAAPADYTNLILVVSNDGNTIVATTAPNDPISLASGNYNVFSLQYLSTDSDAIQSCLANGMLGLSDCLNSANPPCADISDTAIGLAVLPANHPDCSNCDDYVPTVTQSENISTTCWNSIVQFTNTTALSDEFELLTLLINDSGIIVAISTNGSLTFPQVSGDYIVYTLSSHLDNTFPLSVGNSLLYLETAIANGEFCGQLSPVPYDITVLNPGEGNCPYICSPEVGTITTTGTTTLCEGLPLTIAVTGDNTAGHATFFILTDANNNVIAINSTGIFMGNTEGNYTLYPINVLIDNLPLPTPAGTLDEYLLNLQALEFCYAFDNQQSNTYSVLPANSPDCAEACLATYGSVVVTGETTLCATSAAVEFSLNNAATEGYTSLFLVADSDGSIANTSPAGNIAFGEAGTYTVCAFNYSQENETEVNALINGGNFANLQNAIDNNSICAALQANCTIVTVLPANDPSCLNCDALNLQLSGDFLDQVCIGEVLGFQIVQTGNVQLDLYNIQFIIRNIGDDTILAITSPVSATNGTYNLDLEELGFGDGLYAIYPMIVSIGENIAEAQVGLSFDALSDALNDNLYCADLAPPFGVSVLPVGTIPCFPICEASLDGISGESGEHCANEPLVFTPIGNNASPDFVTVLVAVDNTTGNFTGEYVVIPASFSFSPGSKSIYGVNLATANLPALLQLVNNQLHFSVFEGLYLWGEFCAAVTQPTQLEILPCLSPLNVININEQDNGNQTYTISFTIIEGTGNYIVNGSASGSNFTATLPCGQPYNFEVTDDQQTNTVFVSGTSPCITCLSDAGTMPQNLQWVCSGESFQAQTNGDAVLANGDVLVYALHSGNGTSLGGNYVLATNGSFTQGNFANNTIYYVSAVVGPTDANGNIQLNHPCTRVAVGTPIVFLAPISIELDEHCNDQTGVYTVLLTPTGGLPAFDSSYPYSLSGDYQGIIPIGANVTLSFEEGATDQYFLNISDAAGCSDLVGNTFYCTKTPIELRYFKGEVKTNGNLLTWATATEYNNDYFTLERSTNGVNFEAIERIASKGNSTTLQTYTYLDKKAPAGTAYYRLSQTDRNGEATQFNIVTLQRNITGLSIQSVFPIPANQYVVVSYQLESPTTVTITVDDLTGRRISTQHESTTQGGLQQATVEVNSFPVGIYFLSINDGCTTVTTRFIKE